MRTSFLPGALLVLLASATGCRDTGSSGSDAPPPAAEFVLAAGDSTYWIISDAKGIRTRAAPLELARFGGRFFELYIVDDEHSYQDAELLGQSVYRRDLRTGDSVLVFTDTLVPHLAKEYARLHPDDRPVGPDEYPEEDPLWRAAATIDLDAAHGSFLSYTLHTDVERGSAPLWHSSRRGVLDLSSGRAASLASIVGPEASEVERLRDLALRSAVDSVRTSQDERGVRASALLSSYRMDPASFGVTTVDGGPAIAYAVPGSGHGDAGHLLPLAPIRFGAPVWWRDVVNSLPTGSADGAREVWQHAGYAVVVRYQSNGDATLAIRDSTSREWSVARIGAPAERIFWLDRPAVDQDTRRALSRAFDEAAAYGGDLKVARGNRRPWVLAKNRRRVSAHHAHRIQ